MASAGRLPLVDLTRPTRRRSPRTGTCRKSMTSLVFISAFNARLPVVGALLATATITQAVRLCNWPQAAANWYFTKPCLAARMV